MAFVKKTWKDRIVQYANRRLLTKSGGEVEQVTVTRDEGTIYEAGDQFNASNMNDLEQRISDVLDYDETASGSLIHITDGADNIPVKSLTSEIVATQSGSGTPSPSNPRAISGFNSGVVSVCGVNIWDEDWEIGNYDVTTGEKAVKNSNIRCKNPIPCKPNTQFYFKCSDNSGILFYEKDGTYINYVTGNNRVITTPSNAWFICFYVTSGYGTTYRNDISINYPSSDTQYHAYNGNTYTFAFGQTVYGGRLNVLSGELTIEKAYTRADSLLWDKNNTSPTQWLYYSRSLLGIAKASGDCICSHCPSVSEPPIAVIGTNINASGVCYLNFFDAIGTNDLASFNAYITNNNVQLVYELATPIVVQLTPTEVTTLLGENNIFSNCGDIELTYYTDNADDILNFIHGEIGNLLPTIKYEEIDVALDSTGEGTLFNNVKFVVGIKDIPSDSLYVGYASYIVASRTMVKAFSRSALPFTSQSIVSMTRKIGVYYLDNIATQ